MNYIKRTAQVRRVAALAFTCALSMNNFASAQAPAAVVPGSIERTQVVPNSPSTSQPEPPMPVPVPIQTPPQAAPASPFQFIDISNGSFGRLDMAIDDVHVQNTSIDKLHVQANNLDMKAGTLKGLNINVTGGKFPMFVFDQLIINSIGDMAFDPQMMKNDRVIQFKTPIDAEVTATITQQSLNTFLSDPKTLEKLSVTASKKVGMLASLLGGNASNFGITLNGANVVLQKQNRVSLTTEANVGMGAVGGMSLPLELTAKLGLENGWIALSDTHLNTNGSEISPSLSEMLVKKVNGLAGWGGKSDDIQFSFTDLKLVPNKQFTLKGTAKISRLRFGQQFPTAQ